MSEFFTLLLREAESGWFWMYTAALPEEARSLRAEELHSDAWEHEADARQRGGRFGLEFAYRVILGMPADVAWRVQLGRRGFERRSGLELLVASLLAFGLLVALPISGLVLPRSDMVLGGAPHISAFLLAHTLIVILGLVLPGVLVIDRWPVAGGLLVLIGCLCLMAEFWWLREAMGVLLVGTAAAAVCTVRLESLRRR
ncbi:MAG: hypothetical protein HY875_02510 [Chloroflexi bacterium]|nr:hypothetical protein [Chloroflexota bacterium]